MPGKQDEQSNYKIQPKGLLNNAQFNTNQSVIQTLLQKSSPQQHRNPQSTIFQNQDFAAENEKSQKQMADIVYVDDVVPLSFSGPKGPKKDLKSGQNLIKIENSDEKSGQKSDIQDIKVLREGIHNLN